MLEKTSLLKIAMAALFAASLAALPLTTKAQEYSSEPATKSGTAAKSKKATPKAKAAETTPAEPKSTTTESKTARPLTAGQTAARERQKKCGAEWRALSKDDQKAKGPTWPKYWSACNARLKTDDAGQGKAKGKKA
jgi:hypothetical protein